MKGQGGAMATTHPDRLAEAQRIIDQFAPERADELVHMSPNDRAFSLRLASVWAIVDIAQSLRTIAVHTPTPS
jgi:hypothetical protein